MTGGIGALHFTGDDRFMELRNVFFFSFLSLHFSVFLLLSFVFSQC